MENPTFILIGSMRIKLCNIKNYGIGEGYSYHRKLYKKEEVFGLWYIKKAGYNLSDAKCTADGRTFVKNFKFVKMIKVDKDLIDDKGKMYFKNDDYYEKDNDYIVFKESVEFEGNENIKDEVNKIINRYLYVTTYQNDNYTFYQSDCDFNIDEKLKELDRYLT